MPLMKLDRDETVQCLCGQAVAFVAGEAAYVTPEAVLECEAVGAVSLEAVAEVPAPLTDEERALEAQAAADAEAAKAAAEAQAAADAEAAKDAV